MHQELDEGHALVSSDFGHEPIIQDTQPPITHEDEISRMRVTMQVTRFQELNHVTVEQQLHHAPSLVRGGSRLRQLLAIQPLLHQNLTVGEQNLRYHDGVADQLAVLHRLRKAALVGGLDLIVQFLHEGRSRQVDQLHELLRLPSDLVEGQHGSQRPGSTDHVEVQCRLFPDVRTLHLHRHGLTVHGCLVHLTHRSGCHRFVKDAQV
mmetsp:Transcript_73510/g.162355  ORF Transcript_73510/g.162355 Transcript_73510/m.162355 type:complete len:207 (+) Transcript_73510:680-1300(+)